jgi:hypothetical protein
MTLRKRVAGFVAVLLLAACGDAVDPVNMPVQAGVQGGNTVHLVSTKSASPNAVTALIDKQGGILVDQLNGHSLEIPRGAVSEPTYFVMGVAPSDNYVVKLIAYRARDLSSVTQFTVKPLKLRLNYSAAESVSPRRLKIVYVSDDLSQILEVLATSVVKSSPVVEANITHFSIYSMAID